MAGWRIISTLAWRQARRSPLRSLLIVTLIALPIAGLTAAAVSIRTAVPGPEERSGFVMGASDLRFTVTAEGASRQDQLGLPPAWKVSRIGELSTTVVAGGSMRKIAALELPPAPQLTILKGMIVLLEGRWPTQSAEIVLSPGLGRQFGAQIGDALRLEDTAAVLDFVVTGIAVVPEDLDHPLAAFGAGGLEAFSTEATSTFLVQLPSGVDLAAAQERIRRIPGVESILTREGVAETESENWLAAAGGYSAVALVALFATGMIAAAAFAVGARRQLRSLGLISAAGADSRQLRAVVLMSGVSLGSLGAMVGIALGLAGALALHPFQDELTGTIVGPIEIPVPLVAAGGLLGILAALAASYGPARRASRISTTEALASRFGKPPSATKLALLGVGLAAVGVTTAVLSIAQRFPLVLGAAYLGVLTGSLLMIPILVEGLARVALRLPTILRIAARQAARYGRQTTAAVGAASLALTLPIAVSAYSLSQERDREADPRLLSDHIVVRTTQDGVSVPNRLIAEIRQEFDPIAIGHLQPATFPEEGLPRWQWPAAFVRAPGSQSNSGGNLWIGSEALLMALHAETGVKHLLSGEVVALGAGSAPKGVIELQVLRSVGPDLIEDWTRLDAYQVASPRPVGDALPQYLISEDAAEAVGLRRGDSASFGVLVRTSNLVVPAYVERFRKTVSEYQGVFLQTNLDSEGQARATRLMVVALAALIAVAIVGVAVALVAAETRREHATIVAVGASSSLRRALVGANATFLAGLSALVALPAGLLPAAMARLSGTGPQQLVIPWGALATVLLIVPLSAGMFGFLVSREPTPARLLDPDW